MIRESQGTKGGGGRVGLEKSHYQVLRHLREAVEGSKNEKGKRRYRR
jgi:hypothetical protein